MHIFSKPIHESRRLVAQVAMSGLDHVEIPAGDCADFFEGLSSILAPPASEAARYAATCLRECQRARAEILIALNQAKSGACDPPASSPTHQTEDETPGGAHP